MNYKNTDNTYLQTLNDKSKIYIFDSDLVWRMLLFIFKIIKII